MDTANGANMFIGQTNCKTHCLELPRGKGSRKTVPEPRFVRLRVARAPSPPFRAALVLTPTFENESRPRGDAVSISVMICVRSRLQGVSIISEVF